MTITLTINRDNVYKEVAKTTAYTGAKMDDEFAYDKIFTTDEDQEMLLRFWNESKNTICQALKRVLDSEVESASTLGTDYTLTLDVSASFDTALQDSIKSSLFSFFVMNITSKWYTFTNKSETTNYAAEAASYLEDIKRKVFFKKKPTRPTFS